MKHTPNPDVYALKEECLAEFEHLSQQGHMDLLYGDESRVSLLPCVPYGWQFADEQVAMLSEKRGGVNCFALISRQNECQAHLTDGKITAAWVSEKLDALSLSVRRPTVVVLDNAPVHAKAVKARQAVWQQRGLFVWRLPTYSPHLNIQCAETWAKFQRGGALPADAPQTLVVFSGSAADADRFAAETGLDAAQTTLLPDPDLRVTTTYGANPCPRVFVLNCAGALAYTNSHADDAPRRASALVIASRTLDALRDAAATSPASSALAPKPLPVLTLAGKPLNLALKPGWKVLYFWSSTCPCVRDCVRDSFRPLAAKYQGQVAFYAVASGRYDLGRPALVKDIAARHLPYPVMLDPGGHLAVALGASVTPQTFLINPEGRIVFRDMPDDSRLRRDASKPGISRSYLAQALFQALAGEPVTVSVVKDLGCLIGY